MTGKVVQPDVLVRKDDADLDTQLATQSRKQLHVAKEQLDWGTLMEQAGFIAKSTMIPQKYQNYPENCLIAIDLASRMGVSPMFVMQNVDIIQGNPAWRGKAVGALIRTSPKFTNVQVHYVGKERTDSWGAYVTAVETASNRTLKGATVTIALSKQEGWFQKKGSKWQTMPELMMTYRAYAFFGRMHAPEITMGLHAVEEIEDITYVDAEVETVANPFEV